MYIFYIISLLLIAAVTVIIIISIPKKCKCNGEDFEIRNYTQYQGRYVCANCKEEFLGRIDSEMRKEIFLEHNCGNPLSYKIGAAYLQEVVRVEVPTIVHKRNQIV